MAEFVYLVIGATILMGLLVISFQVGDILKTLRKWDDERRTA